MLKVTIQTENTAVTNLYAPSNIAITFTNQKLNRCFEIGAQYLIENFNTTLKSR